ncbi:Uncharacterised protein [Vibrio cholerae]|nr:hypothetical protein VCSRO100_3405 [Vibrio cholerae]SNC58070.1 Uncharacterised protein [Vibrio cholerae]
MQILLMKSWRSFCLLPENKCSNKSLQDFLVLLDGSDLCLMSLPMKVLEK